MPTTPHTPFSLRRALFGPPLSNRNAEAASFSPVTGVPAMGLDAFGSAAYGPEAALSALAAAGVAGVMWMPATTGAVLLVLAILFLSYWQTIRAYPDNGGSYTVAHRNLGEGAGLLAAAALVVDYVLNAAVGISSGVAALVSAVPALQPYTVPLCLSILAVYRPQFLRHLSEAYAARAAGES